MSNRYKGGIISATAPATTTSKGIWTVAQQMQAAGSGVWPAVPGAPTSVTATAGNTSGTVTFSAPSYSGYPATVTGYLATSTPGSFTATGSSSPLTVTGLTNGTSYTIAVQALNATGYGPAGTSGSFTPVNPYYMGVIKPTSNNLFLPQTTTQSTATNSSNMYVVANFQSASNGSVFNITTSGSLSIKNTLDVSGLAVYASSITVAASGNIYMGGYYNNNAAWVVKFNSGGSITWSTNTDYLIYDIAGITTDSSENVYISGRSAAGTTYGTSNSRLTTAKYDSSGAIQWQKQYGSGVDGYRVGNITQYGSLVYAVCSYQDSSYSRYGTLVAYNTSDGSINFQQSFPGNAFFDSIASSPTTGNLYISGQSTNNRSLLIKVNSSGTLQWGRQLDTGYTTTVVAIDSSENVYTCSEGNIDGYTFVLAKYNSSGTIQWQRNISMPSTYSVQSNNMSISANASGGVFVTASVYDGTYYQPFVALFPTDGSGTGSYTFNGGTFTYSASSYTTATDSSSFSPVSNTLTNMTRTVSSNSPSVSSASVSLVKATVV